MTPTTPPPGPEDERWRARQRRGLEALLAGRAAVTSVPIRERHTGRDRCLTSVSFVPSGLAKELDRRVAEPLRVLEPGHYSVPRGDLHVTVKNVRKQAEPANFGPRDVAVAATVFEQVVPAHARFDITLERVVRFPTSVAVFGTTGPVGSALVTALDEGLAEAGLPDDKVYADPQAPFFNVTVCRFTRQPGDGFSNRVVELTDAVRGLTLTVDQVHLVACDAACSAASRDVAGCWPLG